MTKTTSSFPMANYFGLAVRSEEHVVCSKNFELRNRIGENSAIMLGWYKL